MKRRFGVISLYSIIKFCLLYIGISSIFPPINGYLGLIDTIIKIVLNFFMLLIAIKYQDRCFVNSTQAILTVIFILYSTVVPYISGNPVWANRYLDIMFFLTAPLMAQLFHGENRESEINETLYIIFAFGLITLITTATSLISNPYLARSIKSSGEITAAVKKAGIGGYEFVYFVVLMGVAFFYCFWNYRKVLYLTITIACILFAFMSNYMTAVLLIIIGCLIALLSGRDVKQRAVAAVIILLLILFSGLLANGALNFIASLSPNGRIARLFAGNSQGIFQSISEEFMNDRFPTMVASIDAIKSGHGLGLLFKPSSEILTSLGQHSHFLDTLAILGIPMGVIYFYLVLKPLRVPLSCRITFILLLIFNNVTNSIALAVYILIPFVVRMADVKSEAKQDSI